MVSHKRCVLCWSARSLSIFLASSRSRSFWLVDARKRGRNEKKKNKIQTRIEGKEWLETKWAKKESFIHQVQPSISIMIINHKTVSFSLSPKAHLKFKYAPTLSLSPPRLSRHTGNTRFKNVTFCVWLHVSCRVNKKATVDVVKDSFSTNNHAYLTSWKMCSFLR